MAIRRVRPIDEEEETRKCKARLNSSNREAYAAVVEALALPTGITAVNSSSVYYDSTQTSQALSANNMLFISQQIGRNSSGVLATGITNQATQALTNMSNILTQAGLTTANVAHVTMYLTSSSNYSSAIAVFKSVFSSNPPSFDYAAIPNIVSSPSGVLVAFDAYAYTSSTPTIPSLVSNSWPKDSTTVASVGWNPSTVCGDLVFSAMQVAVDPSTGTLTSSTAVNEFNQAMTNLENTIIAAGSNLDKTCRVVLYVTQLSYWSDILTLYEAYFVNAPARELFTVSALPYGGKVGISIISAISGTPSSFNVSGVNSYVPFCQVTTLGNFAYVSNIIGTNSSGSLPSSVTTQASNVMSNLQTIMSNSSVINVSNPNDYALRVVLTATSTTNLSTLMSAYQSYFSNSNKPALICTVTSAGAIYNSGAVSCDVIAYKP